MLSFVAPAGRSVGVVVHKDAVEEVRNVRERAVAGQLPAARDADDLRQVRVGVLARQRELGRVREQIHEARFVEVIAQHLVVLLARDCVEIIRHLVHAPELHLQAELPPAPALGGDDRVDSLFQKVRHLDQDRKRLVVGRIFVCVEQPRHDLVQGVERGPCSALVILHGLELREVVRAQVATARRVVLADRVLALAKLLHHVLGLFHDRRIIRGRGGESQGGQEVAGEVAVHELVAADG